MVAPTLAEMTYQFLDSGVLLGAPWAGGATVIDVSNIDGMDTPDVRLIEEDRDGAHGGFVFSRYMRARSIAIDMTLYDSPATIEATLDTLKANFAPTRDSQPFYFKWPGVAQRLFYGKSQGLRYKIDPSRSLGIQACSVQIKCEDPRGYSSVETNLSGSWPAIVSTGRFYVKTYPYSYGATAAGGVLAPSNAGTVETWPVFTISGSVTAPSITNSTTGQTLAFTGGVGSPNPLIIDTAAGTATMGGVDVTGTLVAGSQWIYLAPGANNIVFSAVAADPGATLSITYRSAYL